MDTCCGDVGNSWLIIRTNSREPEGGDSMYSGIPGEEQGADRIGLPEFPDTDTGNVSMSLPAKTFPNRYTGSSLQKAWQEYTSAGGESGF